MVQKVEINGEEVDVYTAQERQADIDAAVAAKDGEYQPKITELETELGTVRTKLGERTSEIREFRKLSDEQVGKLSESEQVIYQNQLTIAERDATIAATSKAAHEAAVVAAIRATVGTDQKLFDEAFKMYGLVNLEDASPEQMKIRVAAAIGALGQTSPDLLAAAGFSSGSFEPKKQEQQSDSFADSEAGKAAAAELGLIVEPPEQKK